MPRRSLDRSQRVCNIAQQILEPRDPARVAAVLLDERDVAELAEGGVTRGRARQSRRHVRFDLSLQVIAELFGQLPLDAAAAEQRAEAQADDLQQRAYSPVRLAGRSAKSPRTAAPIGRLPASRRGGPHA